MRTVTFLGLIMNAKALRSLAGMPYEGDATVAFYSIILCIAIFMDLVEFNNYLKNK